MRGISPERWTTFIYNPRNFRLIFSLAYIFLVRVGVCACVGACVYPTTIPILCTILEIFFIENEIHRRTYVNYIYIDRRVVTCVRLTWTEILNRIFPHWRTNLLSFLFEV